MRTNIMNVNIVKKDLMKKNNTTSHIESVHEGNIPCECEHCQEFFIIQLKTTIANDFYLW
jgi:hypothetical protein